MRIIILSMLATVGIFAAGCATHTTCDMRGPSEVCEIHHAYMETEMVANEKMPQPSQEYVEARAQMFRHSYPYILPDKCKASVIYVCKDCVREEKEWRRRHSVTK